MSCNVVRSELVLPNRQSIVDAAVASRNPVCSKCEWNKNGVCQVVAAKHGKLKANISHGISRLSVECPIGRWGAVTSICKQCDRSIVVSEVTGVCQWCELKNTTGRQFRLDYAPRKIPENLVAFAFSGEPVRHLHYFLYPRFRESTYYHLRRLEQCSDSFNGKRVCCVAIDESTVHEEPDFKKKLHDFFDVVYYIANDPSKREAAGFVSSLKHFTTTSSNEMICFAHGKGQQTHTASNGIVRQWTDAMYMTVAMNWRGASSALSQGYPIAGAFKSVGNFATTTHRWHYSGSFFWARSQTLFANKAWEQMCNQWFAAESYVGRHFAANEGYCLFGDYISGGSMYRSDTWRRLDPELQEWRAAHANIADTFTD